MSMPSRVQDQIIVFSKLKQSAYGAALTDVNLQGGKRFPVKSPIFGQHDSTYWDDSKFTMRGTDWATTDLEVARMYKDNLVVPGDPWLLAWAAAFALGKVTSTQPNLSLNPTAYLHTIKFLNPATDGKDMPVTTIFAQAAAAANFNRRLLDCAFGSLQLDFPADDVPTVTVGLVGSARTTTGVLASPPSLDAMAHVLRCNNMLFKYGPQGAPVDITSAIVRSSLKMQFSWNVDEANAKSAGAGLYNQRMWIGVPSMSVSWNQFVDDAVSTPEDDWEADTIKELNVTISGDVIGVGPETYQLAIDFPAVKPDVVKLGQAGDKTIYQYSIGKNRFFQQGSTPPCTIAVQNTETSYFA